MGRRCARGTAIDEQPLGTALLALRGDDLLGLPAQLRRLGLGGGHAQRGAGTGEHRLDLLLGQPATAHLAQELARLCAEHEQRSGRAVGGDEPVQRGTAQAENRRDFGPVTRQQRLQAVALALRPTLRLAQPTRLREQRAARLVGHVPAPRAALPVQPGNELDGLGVVQARHAVAQLRTVVHPLGRDVVEHNAASMQLPTQRIAIHAARFHHDLELRRRGQLLKPRQQLAGLLRMRPLHPHPRLIARRLHRGHEGVLGHVDGKHHPLARRFPRQDTPVHALAIDRAVSTLAHGDTSNSSVSMWTTRCTGAVAGRAMTRA
jgi:hypothetical protein